MTYNPFEHRIELLQNGQCAHVGYVDIPVANRSMRLEDCLSTIRKMQWVFPEATTLAKRNAVFVIEAHEGFIRLIRELLPGPQGSIFEASNEHKPGASVATTSGSGIGSGECLDDCTGGHQTPSAQPRDTSIEASALADVELQAEAERSISVCSVDASQYLVVETEHRTVSAEEAEARISACPDPKTARLTYDLARTHGPIEVHFLDQRRTLGGHRPIPPKLYSESTFSLRGCVLGTTDKARVFRMNGNRNDPEWARLRREFPGCEWLEVAKDCVDLPFLQEAVGSGQSVDMDVCVAVTVSSGKRVAVPLKVNNRHELRNAGIARLEIMSHLLMDQTGMSDSLFD